MNKIEKLEVVRLALKDAFALRFAEIETELNESLKQELIKSHPAFMKLVACDENAPYILMSKRVSFILGANTGWALHEMEMPDFSKLDRETTPTVSFRATVPVPQIYPPVKVQATEPVNKKYILAWNDFHEAKKTLISIVCSYSSRERFVKDFPQLGAYLPKLERKPKPPAIIPWQATAKLSELGIPPKESDE